MWNPGIDEEIVVSLASEVRQEVSSDVCMQCKALGMCIIPNLLQRSISLFTKVADYECRE